MSGFPREACGRHRPGKGWRRGIGIPQRKSSSCSTLTLLPSHAKKRKEGVFGLCSYRRRAQVLRNTALFFWATNEQGQYILSPVFLFGSSVNSIIAEAHTFSFKLMKTSFLIFFAHKIRSGNGRGSRKTKQKTFLRLFTGHNYAFKARDRVASYTYI